MEFYFIITIGTHASYHFEYFNIIQHCLFKGCQASMLDPHKIQRIVVRIMIISISITVENLWYDDLIISRRRVILPSCLWQVPQATLQIWRAWPIQKLCVTKYNVIMILICNSNAQKPFPLTHTRRSVLMYILHVWSITYCPRYLLHCCI